MADVELKPCPFCGGELGWNSSNMAADISDDYGDDEVAVVSYYTCRRCGRSFEVFDPTEDERNGEYSEYWNSKR